jgi:hypothetical protein
MFLFLFSTKMGEKSQKAAFSGLRALLTKYRQAVT